MSNAVPFENIITVHQLNRTARQLLESHFEWVSVRGELSNVSRPQSGHVYFTLKDSNAQVRCAMFKNSQKNINFKPQDGLAVVVRASVSIYEGRGDYQLIVSQMEQEGFGALQQAFDALKKKLQALGLFDSQFKKGIPKFPKNIGLVTSQTGAALQDILSVLKRRYPVANIILYPTQVQGHPATLELANAIERANHHNKANVIIVARGGGSLEDLWCFNEERVAHAIFNSNIPIVTGIGHEVDFTIADFVADCRAPTPSAAAETITPDRLELIQQFEHWQYKLLKTMVKKYQHLSMRVDSLEKQLKNPAQTIKNSLRHATQMQQKMILLIKHIYVNQKSCHQRLVEKLFFLTNKTLDHNKSKISQLATHLNAVSPLATLTRGYSIVCDQQSNQIIRDAQQLKKGQVLKTKLSSGEFLSLVTEINAP